MVFFLIKIYDTFLCVNASGLDNFFILYYSV